MVPIFGMVIIPILRLITANLITLEFDEFWIDNDANFQTEICLEIWCFNTVMISTHFNNNIRQHIKKLFRIICCGVFIPIWAKDRID